MSSLSFWADCTLDKDFIRSLQLMMKSMPECSCKDAFMLIREPVLLEDLRKFISSGAPYNINRYAREIKKTTLDFEDFIKVFWDTEHITAFHNDPIVIFGHVLNPVKIKEVSENGCKGLYRGQKFIPISGLYDPTDKIKKGDIVLVHFAMIISLIEEKQEKEIIEHQVKDNFLLKKYWKITEIDYTKAFNNRFAWTQEVYKKYRL